MKRKDRKHLHIAKKEHISKSIDAIQDGDLEKVGKSFAAIDAIDKILGLTRKPNRILPILIGLFCTIIVGISATFKVSDTFVRVVVKTKLISFTTSESYVPLDGRVSVGELTLNSLGSLSSVYTMDTLKDHEVEKLDFSTGNSMELNAKEFGEGTEIHLKKMDSSYSIWSFDKAASSFEIQVDSALYQIIYSNFSMEGFIDEPIPESFYVTTSFTSRNPTQIELFAPSDFSLLNIQTSEISFIEEEPPRSNNYVSGVVSGEIQVFDRGLKHKVSKGDFIMFNGFKGKRVEVKSTGDHYEVILEGTVTSLKTGPKGYLEELKPSWLEYMFNQQFIGFLWSALVFIWGFVWSVRNLFVI